MLSSSLPPEGQALVAGQRSHQALKKRGFQLSKSLPSQMLLRWWASIEYYEVKASPVWWEILY
jgi:hypothetical protein